MPSLHCWCDVKQRRKLGERATKPRGEWRKGNFKLLRLAAHGGSATIPSAMRQANPSLADSTTSHLNQVADLLVFTLRSMDRFMNEKVQLRGARSLQCYTVRA